MREILFRGKSTDNGEWVEGTYFPPANTLISYKLELIDGVVTFMDFCVIPETVGQFTGLTDSNGKRIFDGDIIRYADLYDYNCYLESIDNPEVYDNIDLDNIWTIDEVVYGIKVGYPAFDLNKHDFETNGLSELSESGQYFYEVIGNIHDNPELLKGGEG